MIINEPNGCPSLTRPPGRFLSLRRHCAAASHSRPTPPTPPPPRRRPRAREWDHRFAVHRKYVKCPIQTCEIVNYRHGNGLIDPSIAVIFHVKQLFIYIGVWTFEWLSVLLGIKCCSLGDQMHQRLIRIFEAVVTHEKEGKGMEGRSPFSPKATISHYLAAAKTKPTSGLFLSTIANLLRYHSYYIRYVYNLCMYSH